MSTARVHLSHSISGLNSAAQSLLNSRERSTCSAKSASWKGKVTHCPNEGISCRFLDLNSEWTGSETKVGLQASSTLPGLNHSNNVLVIYGGPTGGLVSLRQRSRHGRVNPNLVHQMYSASPRKCAILPYSGSDTRLAYGYFLGPAYGYGGGFGNGSLLIFIVLGFIAVQAFQSLASGRSERGLLTTREKVSVLKLQVGLLGFARTLQNDLERIADRADTSTSRGLHYVLTETVLALLRQPDMCILGTSLSDVKRGVEAGERKFNQLSLEERGKFDEETLVNVDGNRKKGQEKIRGDGFSNEYIVRRGCRTSVILSVDTTHDTSKRALPSLAACFVLGHWPTNMHGNHIILKGILAQSFGEEKVNGIACEEVYFTDHYYGDDMLSVTLLVAAEGEYNLPAIYDNNDLKDALKKLGSIPADNIQGVEILWTPQDKGDSLSERDLLRNYPLLKSL